VVECPITNVLTVEGYLPHLEGKQVKPKRKTSGK